MRTISWLAFAVLLFAMPGCSFSGGPSWLKGDWIFDLDASHKALNEAPKTPSTGLTGMADAMGNMMLPSFTGFEFRITASEVMVLQNGNGK